MEEYFAILCFADFLHPQNTADNKQQQKIPVRRYIKIPLNVHKVQQVLVTKFSYKSMVCIMLIPKKFWIL